MVVKLATGTADASATPFNTDTALAALIEVNAAAAALKKHIATREKPTRYISHVTERLRNGCNNFIAIHDAYNLRRRGGG